MPALSKKETTRLTLLSILLFTGLLITYWNHFDNPFHFDDFHTIINNPYVKDLSNVPDFFTDHNRTQSTRPVVKTYRPLVTSMNALSYSIGKDYDPFFFHLTIFTFFILQLVLMFFLFKHLIGHSFHLPLATLIALFATGWYAFHMANAETINYIIARSDSMSAMFVTMALVIWIYFPNRRKYGLYLIPAILGLLTKEQAAMFIPLLFFYVLLFEYKLSLFKIFKTKGMKQIILAVRKILPAFIIILSLSIYIVFVIRVPKEPSYGYTTLQYALTQPYVWLHYFISFIFPYQLSIDPEMKIIRGISDSRLWYGAVFISLWVIAIFKTSKYNRWRPVSYGLIWFGVALLPTSSFFPLGQITNDHRMFFPFIGLAMATATTLGLLYMQLKHRLKNIRLVRLGFIVFFALIIVFHAIGTNNRNEIWNSDTALWKEAVSKNPKNARALMNYGLTLMKKDQYTEAKEHYLKAYKIAPEYDYLLVNLGLAYQKLNNPDSAHHYFTKALNISPNIHFVNYYYGFFLYEQNKLTQARKYAIKAIHNRHNYMKARHLLMHIYYQQNMFNKLQPIAEETLEIDNHDNVASFYINEIKKNTKTIDQLEKSLKNQTTSRRYEDLSLAYYRNGNYEQSIKTCLVGLKLSQKQSVLYNNIGAAYIALKDYQTAIPYLQRAISADSSFERAKNNLVYARSKLGRHKLQNENYSYSQWINLSLELYREKDYAKCILCCKKALEIKPNSAVAYNNICSAYNQMGAYEKALKACKKALEINPQMIRAKNNLKLAQSHR